MVKVAVATVSLIVGILLMEGVVRLACRACDPSGGTSFTHLQDGTAIGAPNSRSRQIKNTGDFDVEVVFNELGFRDRKSLQTTPPGSLFVVGDSFAFGWGVGEDERFSNRLEQLLERPVFNIAAGSADFDGYDTLIRYAESHGAHINGLIVAVCMENDLRLYDAASPDSPRLQAQEPARATTADDVKRWLAEHSALRFAVTRAVHSTPWMKRAAIGAGLLTPNGKDAAESDISADAIASSVARLRRLIAGRSAIVLVIPSRGLWLGTDDHRRAVDAAHRSFIRQLRDDGIAVVDVRPMFENDGTPLAYHFANDGHWNADGHRLAAVALAQFLATH